MFNVEVRFKIRDRQVSWDVFISAFLAEAMKPSFKDIQSQFLAPKQPSSPSPQPHVIKAEPRLVNIIEAARLLGISPATVRAYVSRRKISSVRIGRRVLIPTEAINELIKQGLTPAVAVRQEITR